MRRRSKLPQLGNDWVRPHWLERQADPGSPAFVACGPDGAPVNITGRNWTCIGNVDSPREAIVDQRGMVTPKAGGWSLDWWIGAADRWHFPYREVAVRQRLLDDTPVVETAMRIPGGDAVHRAYVARSGEHELAVIEVENQSPVPVALALAVRPCNTEGLTDIKRIELDGAMVSVDGQPTILLPRPPNRMAGAALTDVDVAKLVETEKDAEKFSPLRDNRGVASAAFVFALPHRTTLRVALPIDVGSGRGGRAADLQSATARVTLTVSLPTAQQVANGWGAHGRRGMRLVLPDARLQSCVEANRRHLLVLHDHAEAKLDDTAVSMLAALDLYGYATEVAEVLKALGVERLRPVPPAQEELEAGDRRVLDRLTQVLDAATPTWTWPDGHSGRAAADFLALVRNLLVREVAGGLALCPVVPDDWLGLPLEVHDAPTQFGLLSFAVRWHGDRPALLWELVPHPAAPHVMITAPGLDPTWSSTERKGDALLAPVAPPGTPVQLSKREE